MGIRTGHELVCDAFLKLHGGQLVLKLSETNKQQAKQDTTMRKFIILVACLVLVAGQFATNEGQLLDKLSEILNGQRSGLQQQSPDDSGRQHNPVSKMMSVSVP